MDPALSAANQRQGRTVQPHPARGMGLRPDLPQRHRPRSNTPRLASHLQSPPRPHRTRRQTTRQPRHQPVGTEHLGATLVLSGLDLPAALARFHTRFPVVKLALRTGLVAQLLDGLDAAELDLVVGPVHPGLPRRYVARPLARERLVVISPPAHRLARVDRVRLADLRDEAFVCLPADSGLRALLDAAANR